MVDGPERFPHADRPLLGAQGVDHPAMNRQEHACERHGTS